MLSMALLGSHAAITRPTVDDLRFITGSWRCDIWGGVFEETWSAPADGTMVGVGRHRSAGKTGFMEFMSIETDAEGGITMFIALGALSKGPTKPVPFQLSAAGQNVAVFEREGDDFPTRVHYERLAERLKCTISGTKDGEAKTESFDFVPIV